MYVVRSRGLGSVQSEAASEMDGGEIKKSEISSTSLDLRAIYNLTLNPKLMTASFRNLKSGPESEE